jgi:hypothetical protein
MREITEWFRGHVPADLYAEPPTVVVDREEITVVGPIPGEESDAAIAEFRERTRAQRMEVAARAEDLFGRKVAWGVRAGDRSVVFTNLAIPVMTRLRQSERAVLDTLVAGGVARSRADALAWCVRLVGTHEADWITRMREALAAVHEARDSGPAASN